MTNRTDRVSPEALLLAHALEKLRAREGVTDSRLVNSHSAEAALLLNLSAVQRHAAAREIELAQAAVEVIKECVRVDLNGSDSIVADAVLGLGAFSDTYVSRDIEPRVVETLNSNLPEKPPKLLEKRRETLLSKWRSLHEALGVTPPPLPSDRALRGNIERRVLGELARQLRRRDEYSVGSKSVVIPYAAENHSRKIPMSRSGKVIVVGAAVMDAIFHTKDIPPRGTSVEAYAFKLAPGGKALWQAVGAARLGLEVSLIAAVPNDQFGDEIVDHLEDQGVNIDLIKRADDAHTPFTGVIEFELGDSVAFNWSNRREVRLDKGDIDLLGQHFADCDAVLFTFEIPRETLEHTLALVNSLGENRPLVIVTPGQPYPNPLSGQALSQIDYLVAHAWELGRYQPPDLPRFDVDVAARQLLAYGVETLCLLLDGGCTVYSDALGKLPVPTIPTPYKESSIARDAFCAALAAKLIDGERRFSGEVAQWASAAMAAAIADHTLPNPLPDLGRVEQLFTAHSRFNSSAHSTPITDAGAAVPVQGQPLFPR
jgi:ribokinase